jgi:hypothetical protein
MTLKTARAVRKKGFIFAKSHTTDGSCWQNRARFFPFFRYRLHDDGRATRENLFIDRSGRFIGSPKEKRQPIQFRVFSGMPPAVCNRNRIAARPPSDSGSSSWERLACNNALRSVAKAKVEHRARSGIHRRFCHQAANYSAKPCRAESGRTLLEQLDDLAQTARSPSKASGRDIAGKPSPGETG